MANSAEIVQWVVENLQPFNIVNDRGFRSLMKTGRPNYHIPSLATVLRDVKLVFAKTRERVARMLQVTFSLNKMTNVLTELTELRRQVEFHNRCLVITEP